MLQENYTAILTKAADYRESDKLVRLFTVEGGVMTAVMKGVKKPNAKLKFGAQQFAFCQYTLVSRGGMNTVTGCVQIEDLFALARDYDVYTFASLMLESADAAASGQANPALFVFLLKSYREILYKDTPPLQACAEFLTGLLSSGGFIADNFVPSAKEAQMADIKKLARKIESSFSCKLNSLKLL